MNELQTTVKKLDAAKLEETFTQNEALATRAVAGIEKMISELPKDFTILDPAQGDAVEAEVNDLRKRGADAIKLNRERRMVFTRQFDEIKSALISFEKRIEPSVEILKSWADGWNGEKFRRQEEERKKQEKELFIRNQTIEYTRKVSGEIDEAIHGLIGDYYARMNRAFNQCTMDTLDAYIENLKSYEPTPLSFDELNIVFSQNPNLTSDRRAAIEKDVIKMHLPTMSDFFKEKILEERDRLIATAPGRKEELLRAANDEIEAQKAQERIAKEENERRIKIAQEAEEAKKKAAEAAAMEKMGAALDNAAVGPSVELSKGTQVRLKYAPESHKEMVPIIQWWAANCMPLLTITEVKKKFSFMITAANKELNKGMVIDGVPTVDDVSTRVNRK